MMRRKYGTGKQTNAAPKNGYSNLETIAFELGYLYADTKAKLNALGAKAGGTVSVAELARRVGTLLLSEASGTLLVDSQYLPEMRGLAAEGHEVGPAKTPVHVRPHADRPLVRRHLSVAARKRIAEAQKARWARWKKDRKGVKAKKVVRKKLKRHRHPEAWDAMKKIMASAGFPMRPASILKGVKKTIPRYTLSGIHGQLSRHPDEVIHDLKTRTWVLTSAAAQEAAA